MSAPSIAGNVWSGELGFCVDWEGMMRVVILCAGRKNPAGSFVHKGCVVRFVAHPDRAPAREGVLYARPDDCVPGANETWRDRLQNYNQTPAHNPQKLLPAWRLYDAPVYQKLHERFGDRLYILSGGWGLVQADFLLPDYDITFSSQGHDYAHRHEHKIDSYKSWMMLSDTGEPIVFFVTKSYIPFACKLTSHISAEKHLFYAGRISTLPDEAESFTLHHYPHSTNWHYSCAKDFLTGRLSL